MAEITSTILKRIYISFVKCYAYAPCIAMNYCRDVIFKPFLFFLLCNYPTKVLSAIDIIKYQYDLKGQCQTMDPLKPLTVSYKWSFLVILDVTPPLHTHTQTHTHTRKKQATLVTSAGAT